MSTEKHEEALGPIKFIEALDDYISKKIAQKENLRPADPNQSQDTDQINTALAKAQGEFPAIGLNKENTFLKSKYADIDNIVRSVRSALCKYGLSVTQETSIDNDGEPVLITRLRHSSGQWIRCIARILPSKGDTPAYGSALSSMQRYCYKSLLNITTGDDYFEDDNSRDDNSRVDNSRVELSPTRYKNFTQNTVHGSVISDDQLEQLESELIDCDDITKMVLEGLKIKSLADMPKDKFFGSIKRIQKIKDSRASLLK